MHVTHCEAAYPMELCRGAVDCAPNFFDVSTSLPLPCELAKNVSVTSPWPQDGRQEVWSRSSRTSIWCAPRSGQQTRVLLQVMFGPRLSLQEYMYLKLHSLFVPSGRGPVART